MYRAGVKRVLDILLSVVLMVVFSWLLLLITILYLISGHRDIFFVQERIGWKEKIFRLIKFRTLKKNALLPVDQRQFGLGNILRLTSLDELPQVWNVLRGEMSFIGPRPLLVEYSALFSPQERARHQIRPGITGWAQVNGRNSISWKEKFQYDLYYLQHLSFWLDVRIFIKTIVLLLSLKKDRSLQEEKFTGNA